MLVTVMAALLSTSWEQHLPVVGLQDDGRPGAGLGRRPQIVAGGLAAGNHFGVGVETFFHHPEHARDEADAGARPAAGVPVDVDLHRQGRLMNVRRSVTTRAPLESVKVASRVAKVMLPFGVSLTLTSDTRPRQTSVSPTSGGRSISYAALPITAFSNDVPMKASGSG